VTYLRLDIKKTEVTPKLGLRKRRQQHKGHPGKFATKFHQLVFLAATDESTMGSHNLMKRLSFPYRLVQGDRHGNITRVTAPTAGRLIRS
jgi:hypothetical protein